MNATIYLGLIGVTFGALFVMWIVAMEGYFDGRYGDLESSSSPDFYCVHGCKRRHAPGECH